jgi:hypothetical protein
MMPACRRRTRLRAARRKPTPRLPDVSDENQRSTVGGAVGIWHGAAWQHYRDIPEDEALATVDAAWDAGTRFFDTAPFYGAGLAEIRLGKALSKRPRGHYVLSSKVGRLILDEIEDPGGRDHGEKGDIFKHGRPNKIVPDYSADGTMKSIEDKPQAHDGWPYRFCVGPQYRAGLLRRPLARNV